MATMNVQKSGFVVIEICERTDGHVHYNTLLPCTAGGVMLSRFQLTSLLWELV